VSAGTVALPATSVWSRVSVGSAALAGADRDALGTTARIVVWPAEQLPALLAVVDDELARLDQQASRFRDDSEISALQMAGPGCHLVSDGLAEAVGVALSAAAWTGGLCDPTVGAALIALGYDRDFALIEPSAQPAAGALPPAGQPPDWQDVRLDGRRVTTPPGVGFDLGATAKALGADRAARAAFAAAGRGGVLVSLGGDLAVAGQPPAGGWPVLIADEHRQTRAARNLTSPRARQARTAPATAQLVRLAAGGLATSSVTCRQWLRAGQLMHHIVDPRTGRPADGPWRTVSVAAASCAAANAAATASIVAGAGAVRWLAREGLPARLVRHDGTVCLTGGWPDRDGGPLDPPRAAQLPPLGSAGRRPR
jgi:FAD:protein FMN transferase